jgi:hypothetical protein
MPVPDVGTTAFPAFDAPAVEGDLGDQFPGLQQAESIIAAVAAFLVTDRALRRDRREADRTQSRRLSPSLDRDRN